MAKVVGVGGLFFRAKDPAALRAWYETHLGIPTSNHGMFTDGGPIVWSIFPADTKYFKTDREFMMNLRVDDIDAMVEQLKAAGAEVDPHREDVDYGRFAWFTDPDGNRVELWEPKS